MKYLKKILNIFLIYSRKKLFNRIKFRKIKVYKKLKIKIHMILVNHQIKICMAFSLIHLITRKVRKPLKIKLKFKIGELH